MNPLISIVSDQLLVDEDKINLDSTMDSLNGDSLDQVCLLMKLEDEYDIEIKDEEFSATKNMADLIVLLKSKGVDEMLLKI